MPDEQAPDTETTEPPAPRAHLPEFEGVIPIGVVTKLNGAGERIQRSMHLEERVVLVVEAKVGNVGHGVTKDGVKRIHTLQVADVYELAGREGVRLLNTVKERWRTANPGADELPLEQAQSVGDVVDGIANESGVVMTPEDLKELGLTDASKDPVVAVFEGGTRVLWPDDFGRDPGQRPTAGERRPVPGSRGKKAKEEVLVRELVDALSGETIAEWTDEQEDARLAELEAELAREEARLDREAADELEAARAKRATKEGAPT